MKASGAKLLVETLARNGTTHIFGLPGHTSAPLLDELAARPELSFVLGKHEGPTIAMAEVYARVTGKTGVAHVYNVAGTANALVTIFDAHKNRTPLLVIASQAYQNLRGLDSGVDGEPVELARTMTRSAVEVTRVEQIPMAVARALKLAASPPMPGPCFLSIPMNLLEEEAEATIPDVSQHLVPLRVLGDPSALDAAHRLLMGAREPLIVAGSQVARFGATEELLGGIL